MYFAVATLFKKKNNYNKYTNQNTEFTTKHQKKFNKKGI